VSWLRTYWKWIALAAAVVLVSAAASFLPIADWLKNFVGWFRALGFPGALLYIAIYAVGAVLFVPGAVFTIAAGFIYGALAGTAVAITGATIGAALAFLVARYLVRGRIEKLATQNDNFRAIDSAVGAQGWKIVGLLRLSPLIPFNVSNYFYGVTSIRFWPYLLASAAGMLPGTWLFAYLGAIGQAGIGSGGQKDRSVWEWTFLGVGLLATVTVTLFVSRLARKSLQEEAARRKS
jgi:uncharacterized membrane protein YdjX (TVP38/TMEM64 family)